MQHTLVCLRDSQHRHRSVRIDIGSYLSARSVHTDGLKLELLACPNWLHCLDHDLETNGQTAKLDSADVQVPSEWVTFVVEVIRITCLVDYRHRSFPELRISNCRGGCRRARTLRTPRAVSMESRSE